MALVAGIVSLIFEDGGWMSETTIKDLLCNEQDKLRVMLSVSLDHPTTQGDQSEQAWIKLLKSFLPSKFSVAKGFVFDSHGNRSQQIDVIVYDNHHSPLIYTTESGETYITAESVYAVFECKQKITSDNIRYANEKIQSVVALDRTSRGMYSSGVYQQPRDLPDIIGGLLATSGTLSNKGIFIEYSNLDLCASLDGGTTLITRDKQHKPIDISTSEKDDAIPALYFSLLDSLHRMGTVPAIDIRKYAQLCALTIELPKGN